MPSRCLGTRFVLTTIIALASSRRPWACGSRRTRRSAGIDLAEHAETAYELGDTGGGGVFAGVGHAARNNTEVEE